MTDRTMTGAEIERSNAEFRRWVVHVLTLGLVPKLDLEREIETQ